MPESQNFEKLKQNLQQVEFERDLFKLLLNNTTDCLIIFDQYENIIFRNTNTFSFLEINPTKLTDLIFENSLPKVRLAFDNCLAQKIVAPIIVQFNGLSQKKSVLSVKFSLLYSDNGKTAISCIFRPLNFSEHDTYLSSSNSISRFYENELVSDNLELKHQNIENKQLLKKLKQSEEQYKILVENSPNAIFVYSQAKILLVNAKAIELLQANSSIDLIGKDFMNFVDSCSKKSVENCLNNSFYLEPSFSKKVVSRLSQINGNIIDVEIISSQIVFNEKPAALVVVNDVTEQLKYLNDLQESEEKFRFLAEELPNMIFISTKNSVEYANKASELLTGYSRDEIYLQNFNLFQVLDIEQHKLDPADTFNELIKNSRGEFVIKTKSGERLNIIVSAKLIKYKRKKSTLGIVTDITERKKAEEILRQSEEKLQSLIHSFDDQVLVIDSNGVITEIHEPQNTANYLIPENFISKTLIEAELPDSLKYALIQTHAKVIESQNVQQFDYELINNEKKHWYSVKVSPKKNRNGRIDGIIAVSREVTMRKEALISKMEAERKLTDQNNRLKRLNLEYEFINQQLRDSELKFRTYIESSPTGIFIIEERGYFQFVNSAACNLVEYRKEELLNLSVADLIPARLHRQLIREIIKINRLGKHTFETVLCRKYETNIDVIINIVKITGNRYLAFGTDITAWKKYENELKLAKEKAEASDNLKSAFLANMSHEIRTPMNGIIGFAELLRDQELSANEQQDYIELIYNCGNHLLEIINDILDISKIEVGQLKIRESYFNLNFLIDELYAIFNSPQFIGNKNITLRRFTDLENSDAVIISDSARLKQILTNLINNAIKFTDKGYVEFGYKVDFFKSELKFVIRDTGIGLAPNKQELIFERFMQSDQLITREYGGTGLGLSISKGLIELMGGKIWLHSEPNKGSTFYFTIPYKPSIKLDSTNEFTKTNISYNWKGKTVLIAEDENVNFYFMKKLLIPTQISILRARTGLEVLSIIDNNNELDLILMDIKMPDMNGIQATQIIRAKNISTPIIAQTAYAHLEDQEAALAAGCNDYLSKPINRLKLFSLMNKYLND